MSDIIQLLPDHVANQIAAGEVVQRPASVVKELLENAIDANATSITLILKEAGKNLIQVIDNGIGMSETDARMCFERHATSKIKEATDLFNLNTKGFRGEAMASIAAIAQVDLKTKKEDADLGTQIKIEGSKIISQEVTSTTTGTNTCVKNLFFNIPARRNFLKSDAVETRHIIDEFQRVALVHPEVSFKLNHNNSEVFNLPAGNLRQRIVGIFGSKTNEKLIPIQEETDIVQLKGFIIKPEFSKKKRGEQFFFVNDRFIKSPYLHHAINAAYDGLLEQGTHASYFLYMNVPNSTIDINIHPTKTEVKFDNEKVLYEIIKATVKHGLGQFNISAALDFSKDQSMETPYEYKDKIVSAPKIEVDPNFNPFKTQFNSSNSYNPSLKGTDSNSKSSYSPPVKREKKTENWDSLYNGIDSAVNQIPSKKELSPELFESKTNSTARESFQIYNKYIISNMLSGMVMIHQNLAHQRVLYENFLENITVKEAASQQLLFPITINFGKQEIEILKNLKDELESTGFLFDKIEEDGLVVKGIPASISESKISIVFDQLLEDFQQEVPETNFSQLDTIAKSLAKTLAIKSGAKLSTIEQENLINELFSCKDPKISPLGKKIFIKLNSKKLDAIFNAE